MTKSKLDVKAKHFIIVGLVSFSWKDVTFLGQPAETQIIFIDGGLIHKTKFQMKAYEYLKTAITLGDGDSALQEMQLKKTAQNLSDLSFFLKKSQKLTRVESFSFVGFLGGKPSTTNRLDHLLFNIFEIADFRKRLNSQTNLLIKMDNEVFFYSSGIHKLKVHGRFSFLSLDENQIKMKGQCEYKILKKTTIAPLSSRGLSNIGNGVVTIEATTPFFLIMS